MIRPLRQRHRHTFFSLGVLLPIALVVGFAARKPVPVVESLPGTLATPAQHLQEIPWTNDGLFTNAPVKVHLFREMPQGALAIGFSMTGDFIKPDLIAYWVDGSSAITDSLPNEARLLGQVNNSLTLPLTAIPPSPARLVLYSLAIHEVVDVSKPFALPKP